MTRSDDLRARVAELEADRDALIVALQWAEFHLQDCGVWSGQVSGTLEELSVDPARNLDAMLREAELRGARAMQEAAAERCDNAPAKPNQSSENLEVESAHWCAAEIRAIDPAEVVRREGGE